MVLSFTIGPMAAPIGGDFHNVDQIQFADAKGGGGKGGSVTGPAIDLPTVVLHELGHSLGLDHSNSPACGAADQPVMCPYYIGPAFELKTEDLAKISSLYPNDALVANSEDDRWDNPSITFSFMPDGASIDQGGRKGSELDSVMQQAIGTNWQSIFDQALAKWAEASGGTLQFSQVDDDGSSFNVSGLTQGDPRFGDIRFGSHKFDRPGGVLAHAYFPPPNGATAAGDAHFAKEENWKDLSNVTLSSNSGLTVGGSAGSLTSARGNATVFGDQSGLRGDDVHAIWENTAPAALVATAAPGANVMVNIANERFHYLSTSQRDVLEVLPGKALAGVDGAAASVRSPILSHATGSRVVIASHSSSDRESESALDSVLAAWSGSDLADVHMQPLVGAMTLLSRGG